MKPEEPKWIQAQMDVDTSRLYHSIDEAITYLAEVNEQHADKISLALAEDWTGYEDMNLVFTYQRLETPEEVDERLRIERKKQAAERAKMLREAQRQKDMAEYKRLRRKLWGIYD